MASSHFSLKGFSLALLVVFLASEVSCLPMNLEPVRFPDGTRFFQAKSGGGTKTYDLSCNNVNVACTRELVPVLGVKGSQYRAFSNFCEFKKVRCFDNDVNRSGPWQLAADQTNFAYPSQK